VPDAIAQLEEAAPIATKYRDERLEGFRAINFA
jgi:hypothetical protein